MTQKLLHESAAVPLVRKGARWLATLITPGQGSSGFYSEEVLAESGVQAFTAGSKNYFMHPERDGQQRDPRDQWGFIPENVRYEPGVGVVGEIEILPHWREVVEALGEAGQADLSIWAMGEVDDEGNVTKLFAHPSNGVDMVGAPGRPGSKLTQKMYESARAGSVQEPDAKPARETQQKENQMEKEILEALVAIKESLVPVVSFVNESKTAATAKVEAEANVTAEGDAVAEALDAYEKDIAAIDAAGLPAEVVESLRASAKKGDDVAPLIENMKKLGEAFTKSATTDSASAGTGRVTETASATADFSVAGWGN